MGKSGLVGTTGRDLSSKRNLSHLTVFSYHLISIELKQEPEIICQLVESIRKLVITPVIVLLSEHAEIESKIIYLLFESR